MNKIGFSGTRHGMTAGQQQAFRQWIRERQPHEFHHGDCIGADAQAHDIVREVAPACRIVLHPPINSSKRAFCHADIELLPHAYLRRNKNIVLATSELVATPFEHT
ncbi:MAG TPA: hypothetical protein VJ654_11325 [Noviherbaspirillum sp.]|nr:hypothetical protein [Noviherbaspirillum sp.]